MGPARRAARPTAPAQHDQTNASSAERSRRVAGTLASASRATRIGGWAGYIGFDVQLATSAPRAGSCFLEAIPASISAGNPPTVGVAGDPRGVWTYAAQ